MKMYREPTVYLECILARGKWVSVKRLFHLNFCVKTFHNIYFVKDITPPPVSSKNLKGHSQ